MVWHVGYDVCEGDCAAYNEITKKEIIFFVGKIERIGFSNIMIDLQLKRIKAKLNGKLGCACLLVNTIYDNDLRKALIERGLYFGFLKVEISDSTLFLKHILKAKYKPNPGDMIWIGCWPKCYIWEKSRTKAKMLKWFKTESYNNLLDIKQKYSFNKNPNLIVDDTNFVFDEHEVKKKFPKCHYFKFEIDPKRSIDVPAALIKARIMAKNPEVLEYEMERQLNFNMIVLINEKEILSFEEGVLLPLEETLSMLISKNARHLKIIAANREDQEILHRYYEKAGNDVGTPVMFRKEIKITNEMLMAGKILLTFKIDENRIFSAEYSLPRVTQKSKKERVERLPKELVNFENPEPSTKSLSEMLSEKIRQEKSGDDHMNIGVNYTVTKFKKLMSSDKESFTNNSQDIKPRVSNQHIEKNGMLYNIPQKLNLSNFNINAVGIDLGMTRCCAAVYRRNGIETVSIDNLGERMLPSYVSFQENKEQCGKTVVLQLQNYAKSTVFDSKRIIGRNFEEVKMDENWPFKVVNMAEKPMIVVLGPEHAIKKSPEEIAAVLLKHIKEKLEDFQGNKLTEVVITVPAEFNENQKSATTVAGLLAGWDKVHLIPEPIAASFAYFIDRPIPITFTMMLFDLGGGTLDVCIFKIKNQALQVVCQIGDNNLGGRDFDQLLFNHIFSILKEQHVIDVKATDKLKYRLMQKCIEIKHVLLDISDFNPFNENDLNITRQEFESMAIELLNKIQKVIVRALSITNYTSRDINKVLFAGGSSRMPMVKHLLQSMFIKAEHCCEENPDEVVAIGAAYYAYNLGFGAKHLEGHLTKETMV